MTVISNAEELSRKGLEELGPVTGKEKMLIAFFILAIIGWVTGSFTQIDATVVALVFFSLCAIFKLISWDNVLNNKGAWSTLMWYGAIIGLANILASAKFFEWLAKMASANIQLSGYNVYIVLFVLLMVLCYSEPAMSISGPGGKSVLFWRYSMY